ncbi:MAG TPA: hypothetical protein PKC87_00815 [Candidatus Absconditabacterales bacterium]|mgnify:CR=1 FL=1|nr:hypothetical protein [Candidatus Absconditabacterales bacterium]
MKELPDTFKEYIIYQLEYGKIKMCSAFTSLFFHKGYTGFRYREVYSLVQDEIRRFRTEEGVKRKEQERLLEEKKRMANQQRSLSMKRYWEHKKNFKQV